MNKWGRAMCPVVWMYYIWITGRKKGNWGISRIIHCLKENGRKTKGIRKIWISFFPVGDSQKSKRVFLEVYAWLGLSVKVGTLFFHQVGQIWVWWALDRPDFCGIARSTIWARVQGLFCKKWKKMLDFHILGVQQKQKQLKKKWTSGTKSVKSWSPVL